MLAPFFTFCNVIADDEDNDDVDVDDDDSQAANDSRNKTTK